jgi:hypothetical protein
MIPSPTWRNTMSAFDATVPVLQRTLKALDACLDKAQAHADAVKFDSVNLFGSRLAPDMFPLGRQIQIACDFGKSIPSRLAGVEVPKWEDNEVTMADFKARIAKTQAYLATFKPEQFKDAEKRDIEIPMRDGSKLEFNGADFINHFALPNVYFHVTTAYNILRHNGVAIGKRDFIGGK